MNLSDKLADTPVQRYVEDVERRTASHPIEALALAFAAGAVLTSPPGRAVIRCTVRTGLMLAKPALLIAGLCKAREMCRTCCDEQETPAPQTSPER